jgi:hypothetical protein
MRIARLWSKLDSDGVPDTAEGMSHVEEDERKAFCRYLDSASLVVRSPMKVDDVVNPDSGVGIPVMWFTDGEWIWSAQLSYYLRAYGLIFETELLDHIRQAGFSPAAAPKDVREEALQMLLDMGEQHRGS